MDGKYFWHIMYFRKQTLDGLESMESSDLDSFLLKFYSEVRTKNKSEYSKNVVHI